MILPFNIKIGNVGVEICSDNINSSEFDPKGNLQFEHISRCWSEVENVVDMKLQEYKGNYKPSQSFTHNAKMKLMVEIVRILREQGVKDKILVDEILKTGKFSEAEAKVYIDGS
jgi:hypothetical protein